MMALLLCLCLWIGGLIAKIAPRTPVGRACQGWLIDKPALWLSTLTFRKITYAILSTTMMVIFLTYLLPVMSGEVALLLAGDMLAYVELFAALTMIAIRSGTFWPDLEDKRKAFVARVLGTLHRGARQRSAKPRRKTRLLTPFDEDEPAFAMM